VVASCRQDSVRTSRGCCLNPLHRGAVVASIEKCQGDAEALVFQSPSLRGSGRFKELDATSDEEVRS